ncbi:conserved oligomeric Golgi complex subunit 2 [Diabrotica virgifera virgifera]|uniref:Conserved oligomeric Golgi complex subunit 2 n=1 Tax=Diabrotica virgifera virgifera TaxID=50390 RepID=A0A6P7H1T5_DIAVI|nr:conserved oligomeric Golgi complex subunit 2 [Diabrotica virgifera virgifera]
MTSNDDILWKESFFEKNFSVDNSLSTFTQKYDLDTLRSHLKSYGTELQQRMSEILKDETEAIVNLAEYLTNLNVKIEHLSLPFFQLREEIMALNQLISNAEMSYGMLLNNIKDNNTSKNNLNLKLGVISCSVYIDKLLKNFSESLDLIILERIVGKYALQKSYVDELEIVTTDMQDIMVTVEDQLVKVINNKFLQAIEADDSEIVTRCLRMYDSLKKHNDAEDIYRRTVVRPYLQRLFSDNSVEKSNQSVDKIYKNALDFIDTNMKVLTTVVETNADLNAFNFIYNSFWKEFDKQSREGLPHITAPGNPEQFQKRYKSTYEVLLIISKKCKNEDLITQDESFTEHLKRFNLPVYLEIRYQKIASDFESALDVEVNEFYAAKNEISCKLKPTLALWIAVSQCFDKDIYLDQLADQFIRLSMLLLSRYLKWSETTLKVKFSTSEETEKFIMSSLIDFTFVENLLCPSLDNPSNVSTTIYGIISWVYVIPNIIKANRKTIIRLQNILKSNLIKMKVDEICNQLQHVGSIPRLYRRTNRSSPKEPSSYMVDAVKPITTFHNEFTVVVKNRTTEILNDIILQVTNHYLNLVQSVLRSVCKTEESLRRLKSRNVNISEEISPQSDSGSDEIKIREQIKLDVAYFLEKLHPLGSEDSRQTMDLLKDEIN